MANQFTQALSKTMSFEGTDRVKEPTGDISVMGIRQDVYDRWARSKGLPLKDVESLSSKERALYVRDEFVIRPKIDELPDDLFPIVFDFGFNAGPETAISNLQKVVGAKADGIIGPETLTKVDEAIKKKGIKGLVNEFLDVRQQYNESLINRNKYQKGLKKRVDAFRR